jgi:sarcosine oxidase gamma subunit
LLELNESEFGVVTCVADPAACDALSPVAGARTLRPAPDEVMVLGDPSATESLLRTIETEAVALDPDAVVIDASDGWATWTLSGDAIDAALSRLSPLELPREGFAQGDVARVPAKLVAAPGRLDLLVPSMWRDYLRDSILQRCRTLGIGEGAR